MMISEFIERTGFEPTYVEYLNDIEPEYMGTEMDKDAFCKQWKKNGGISRLTRKRARTIEELQTKLLVCRREKSDVISNLRETERKLDAAEERRKEESERLTAELQAMEMRAQKTEKALADVKAAFAVLGNL